MHDFVSEYAALAERFAVTVAMSDLNAPVPACPRWSTYDLVAHLGNIAAWAATILETGCPATLTNDEPGARESIAASQWYAGKAEDLDVVLRQVDANAECWNFTAAPARAGFWVRRQVLETALHLVDLQQAAGRETFLPPSLCADGIDEVLSVFVPLMHFRGRVAALAVPLTVSAVDVRSATSPSETQRWTLLPGNPPTVVTGVVDVEGPFDGIAGPASVLWTLLWKRLGRSVVDGSVLLTDPELSYSGDPDRVASFLASRLTP